MANPSGIRLESLRYVGGIGLSGRVSFRFSLLNSVFVIK